jgi:hypothetical protein
MLVSLASEPEPVKNTWRNGGGVTAASRSASAVAGGVVVWKKAL